MSQQYAVEYIQLWSDHLIQECTNPRCQVARATEFCTAAVSICEPSMWNLSHINPFGIQNIKVVPEFF